MQYIPVYNEINYTGITILSNVIVKKNTTKWQINDALLCPPPRVLLCPCIRSIMEVMHINPTDITMTAASIEVLAQ